MLSNVLSLVLRTYPQTATTTLPCGTFSVARMESGIAATHPPRGEILASLLQSHRPNRPPDRPAVYGSLARKVHCAELVAIFDRVFASKARDEWVEILLKEKLMVCPVLNINEIKDDSQARVNNYVVDFEDRFLGDVKIPGYPVHFSANQAALETSPRIWGTHRPGDARDRLYRSGNPGTEKGRGDSIGQRRVVRNRKMKVLLPNCRSLNGCQMQESNLSFFIPLL